MSEMTNKKARAYIEEGDTCFSFMVREKDRALTGKKNQLVKIIKNKTLHNTMLLLDQALKG